MDPHGLLKSRHLTITFKILCITPLPAFQTPLMPSSAQHCTPENSPVSLPYACQAPVCLSCLRAFELLFFLSAMLLPCPYLSQLSSVTSSYLSFPQHLAKSEIILYVYFLVRGQFLLPECLLYKGFITFYFISSTPKSTPTAELIFNTYSMLE